jgi:hypothetical protein
MAALLVELNDGAACIKGADCDAGDAVDLWYVCGHDASDEVWELPPGGDWQLQKDQTVGGLGENYVISLYAGQMYRAGVYTAQRGPTSARPDPRVTAWAMATCFQKPTPLITDSGVRIGGTFAHPWVKTTEPTKAMTAVSVHRIDEPDVAAGWGPKLAPHVFNPVDGKDGSDVDAKSHLMLFEGLHPGERYYYSVVVVTPDGRWDYRIAEFTTKRRKIVVNIDQLEVLNDGDVGSVGEARFWFEVGCWEQSIDGNSRDFNEFEVFALPRSDVDDGQKIKLGYAHIGDPTDVTSDVSVLRLRCWGDELDDFGKDRAQGETLRPIPRGVHESVTDEEFFVP